MGIRLIRESRGFWGARQLRTPLLGAPPVYCPCQEFRGEMQGSTPLPRAIAHSPFQALSVTP
jgi:hypothetical protein